VERTLAALAEFGSQARSLGAVKVAAVGTSALRDAANGPEFVAEASRLLGGPVEVIAGEREAHLTYTAARRDPEITAAVGSSGATVATIDIGGWVHEIVIGRGDTLLFRESLQLGAVRLTERVAPSDPWTDGQITDAMLRADQALAAVPDPGRGGGRGGQRRHHREPGLGRTRLADVPAGEAPRLAPDAGSGGAAGPRAGRAAARRRRNVPGIEPDRADVLVAGAIIQARALYRLNADAVFVSLRGLRYGLLYELLG
jgi:exopolyphosphatase/guanosine-5'-triphosphate,3'-diphosphate pyrophosphatase